MTKIGSFIRGSIFVSYLFASSAFAAGTTVQAIVDRTEMGVGDTFTYSVVVQSSEDVQSDEPNVKEVPGLEFLNKWSQASVSQKLVRTDRGMQFETQRRKDFSYMLSAQKAGTFVLPPAEITVDGKSFKTQAITIKVGQNSSGGNRQLNRPQLRPQNPFDNMDDMDSAEEEMFNQLLRQRQQLLQQFGAGAGVIPPDNDPQSNHGMINPQVRTLPKNHNEAFFVQVEVDKTEVYEGEQVTVNWYIYTRGQMETLERLKFPDLKGFWKEIIEEVPSIQFGDEVVNGVPYRKALLASHALFPIRAGTQYIDEYRIKSRVRVPTGNGFFGRAYEFTKNSERVKINVKPLPTEGRPASFAGAVGQFDVRASVEGQSFPVNQPFSLKIRYEGAGNAKMIDLPALNLPAGIEVYDTKSESKFFKNGRSYKEFEVLIIPRQEGELNIPALTTSFFDSQSKKYYSKTSEALKVQIIANPNAPVGTSNRITGNTPAAKPAVVNGSVLPEPIVTWEHSSATQATNPLIWGSSLFAVLLALLWKAQKEIGFVRRRKTLRDQVAKRFKRVDEALVQNDIRKVGSEITNMYYLVLGQTVGAGSSAQELSKILEKAPPSLRRDYGSDILKSFEIFQTISFAPEEMLGKLAEPTQMKENVKAAKNLIDKIVAAVTDQTE